MDPNEVKAKAAAHPHLAIEALRAVINRELAAATRNNVVREGAFSDRIADVPPHQPAAHLRGGDRRADCDGERGCS
ncbi:MAG: DUF3387 domain-containing protein [Mycobacterium sp.]|nr:DUF3387 domain-containing protein [Mycobacterium sp.]